MVAPQSCLLYVGVIDRQLETFQLAIGNVQVDAVYYRETSDSTTSMLNRLENLPPDGRCIHVCVRMKSQWLNTYRLCWSAGLRGPVEASCSPWTTSSVDSCLGTWWRPASRSTSCPHWGHADWGSDGPRQRSTPVNVKHGMLFTAPHQQAAIHSHTNVVYFVQDFEDKNYFNVMIVKTIIGIRETIILTQLEQYKCMNAQFTLLYWSHPQKEILQGKRGRLKITVI